MLDCFLFARGRLLAPLALTAPFTLGAAACGSTDTDAPTSSDDLIGGAAVAEDALPGVIGIVGGCTAAKVGPRHILLAAHCVTDFYEQGSEHLRPAYRSGARLSLTQSRASNQTTHQAVVADTFVPDTWKKNCAGRWGCSVDQPSRWSSPDIALVVTTEDIARIPTALVDLDPVRPGDRVVLLGYGCEERVGGPFDYSKSRLKMMETTIATPSTVRHPGSFITTEEDVAIVDQWVSLTKGPGLDRDVPGLCPGDSGGPLLRAGASTTTVVGVNSSYTFVDRSTGLPATNWQARVDGTSGIGAFLERHGVAVTHGCSAPGTTCSADAGLDASDADDAD